MDYQQLLDLFKMGSDPERAVAAVKLGKLKDIRAANPLIEGLKDPSLVIRDNCAFALAEIGAHEAVPHIIRLLTDHSITVRKSAAKALGLLKAREAVPELIVAMKDSAFWVRKSAIRSLGQIGGARALEALKGELAHEAGSPFEPLLRTAIAEITGASR